jgi:hypothetical protein
VPNAEAVAMMTDAEVEDPEEAREEEAELEIARRAVLRARPVFPPSSADADRAAQVDEMARSLLASKDWETRVKETAAGAGLVDAAEERAASAAPPSSSRLPRGFFMDARGGTLEPEAIGGLPEGSVAHDAV